MKSDLLEMMAVTLEAAEALPLARRVKVLRGLAAVTGDKHESAELLKQADLLAHSDALCREFKFSFIQKNS